MDGQFASNIGSNVVTEEMAATRTLHGISKWTVVALEISENCVRCSHSESISLCTEGDQKITGKSTDHNNHHFNFIHSTDEAV